jgi:hypothetical protein
LSDDTPGRCCSVRQLASHWRCSPKRVRDLIRRGVLQAFVIARAVRITPEAVHEAERLLAAPTAGVRRRRDNGIDREVAELLESNP